MTLAARSWRARRRLVRCAVGLGLGWSLALGAAPASAQPAITFLGLASPGGMLLQPSQGAYQLASGSGVLVIVEGGPGTGTDVFNPGGLPDLQLQLTQPLGNASSEVCDPLGGVPAPSPADPLFSDVDAVNDFACRFVTETCTVDGTGEPRFVNPASALQFCAEIGPSLTFHSGETALSVRLRGTNGMVGLVSQIHIQVGPVLTATPTHTATIGPSPLATVTASPTATQTAPSTPSATSPFATATSAHTPTATPVPPTHTETAIATGTVRVLIDLESLIHALFAPVPPSDADVNGDLAVNAADLTTLLHLQAE